MNDEQATAIVAAILIASSMKEVSHPAALGNYAQPQTLSAAFQLARMIVAGTRGR